MYQLGGKNLKKYLRKYSNAKINNYIKIKPINKAIRILIFYLFKIFNLNTSIKSFLIF